jgi:16S rRNA (uracil1498-N3)-methyltransferase
MHRFYLPPPLCQGDRLGLSGPEAHHALHVLRLAAGDPVTVLDGAGGVLDCEVAATGRRAVTLAVRRREQQPRPELAVTLFQAVAKTRAMEWIVQKATELGVRRLTPVLTERSVPRFAAGEAEHKAARWREIAVEALKQCGTPWLPEILAPAPLAATLEAGRAFELALVAALAPGAGPPRRMLEEFRARHPGPAEIAVWIGPEGDFTAAELEAIRGTGARPVTLGSRVLRCDTAAVYCLSVLNYELLPA